MADHTPDRDYKRRQILKIIELRADDAARTWDSPLSGVTVVSSLVDIMVRNMDVLTPVEFGVMTRATAMIFRQAMTPPAFDLVEPRMEAAE